MIFRPVAVKYILLSQLTAQCLGTVSLLLELLFVKLGYFSVPCLSQDELVMPFTFYVPIDFIFYLIVFFLVLTTVPCVRFI